VAGWGIAGQLSESPFSTDWGWPKKNRARRPQNRKSPAETESGRGRNDGALQYLGVSLRASYNEEKSFVQLTQNRKRRVGRTGEQAPWFSEGPQPQKKRKRDGGEYSFARQGGGRQAKTSVEAFFLQNQEKTKIGGKKLDRRELGKNRKPRNPRKRFPTGEQETE